MPNKCGVVNFNGNYNDQNKCRVFKMPREDTEQQQWINALPPIKDFQIDPSKFFICERHWPLDCPMKNLPGGFSRPTVPPSIFNVPPSCLPTPKPEPRQTNAPDRQLKYFLEKDKISDFSHFSPEKELRKKYDNLFFQRSEENLVCIFMSKDFTKCLLTCIINNKATLTAVLTMLAFKDGIRVPMSKLLQPNNGLRFYSQFFEAVHFAISYVPPVEDIVHQFSSNLKAHLSYVDDPHKAKRLEFINRQLQLFCYKNFSTADYCFAIECYPRCGYNNLRKVLTLPSKRKLQSIISATDICDILEKTFNKVKIEQQKLSLLLVDEVKIRPTVAYGSGCLNGMAKNDPDSKASSMLCIMMKSLHRGPSLMISVIPVHKMTAKYQFSCVINAARIIEKAGGTVVGSITDNHKVNQQYCKLFQRTKDYCAIHPLDENRFWYLLYDTVHLLKCIRNNWITEKCQRITLDHENIGNFSDIIDLYKSENGSILKSTPLTYSAVYPSKLQLQNVQHVLKVFNDKVIAALRLRKSFDTANFIQQILNWWNTVNVSSNSQNVRMKDPFRSVQTKDSSHLKAFLDIFKTAESGHGGNRINSLTHDTKRALVQTTEGLIAICNYLLNSGFKYVLLRELQSDRIEGEFSTYRQANGGNAFMSSSDVFATYKKRLARFAASYLESIDNSAAAEKNHECIGDIESDDAALVESCVAKVILTHNELNAAAYVSGWLERKCKDLIDFSDDDPIVNDDVKLFIEEVSRGSLIVPHQTTYEIVQIGLCFVKHAKHRTCCRSRLVNILKVMHNYYDLGPSCENLFFRLANVLLHGIHNLEKDQQQAKSISQQTSIKKARLC